MAEYIESPKEYEGNEKSVFMAGGITGCPNWQKEVFELLKDKDCVFLNPRRKNFPIDDPSAAKKQITWEHDHLREATAILFWFPKETICPIVLYELGTLSMAEKPIFIGVHPKYQRKQDIEIQTELVRPDVRIVYNLKDLAAQIRKWI